MKIKVKRRSRPHPASKNVVYELTASWVVECTLLAPDPAGYQAVIVDEQNRILYRSVPERGPIDFEHRRFQFVFVPPVVLPQVDQHRYRIGVIGPSGTFVPFEAPSWVPTHQSQKKE